MPSKHQKHNSPNSRTPDSKLPCKSLGDGFKIRLAEKLVLSMLAHFAITDLGVFMFISVSHSNIHWQSGLNESVISLVSHTQYPEQACTRTLMIDVCQCYNMPLVITPFARGICALASPSCSSFFLETSTKLCKKRKWFFGSLWVFMAQINPVHVHSCT